MQKQEEHGGLPSQPSGAPKSAATEDQPSGACGCVADVNAKLAPDHLLNATMTFRAGEPERPIIALIRRDTWKPETRRGRPGFMVASYCPFCGSKYRDEAKATGEQP